MLSTGNAPAPVADASSPWMQHLERAHELAHAAARVIEEEAEPSAHLAPAARQLERGIAAMYDAFDGRADRISAIGAAHARLWDAAILLARAGLPGALAKLRAACGELIAAEERFPRVPLAPRAKAALRASFNDLPLHTVERASLAPTFRAPPLPAAAPDLSIEDMPEPTTFEELAAAAEAMRKVARERAAALVEPAAAPAKQEAPAPAGEREEERPPGFALAPPSQLDEGDFIRRWARECFEEIGMLGLQRAPLLGDDWRACQLIERRLVAAIDALAALGPIAIARVEPLAMDAPAADPLRVIAAALIGGCLEGRDAIAGAERVLHRFGPGDPIVAGPFAAAMKLAPSPFVSSVARALLASSDRACRAIAVDVLAHRGWLTAEDLAKLADEEDPRALALALPALAALRHPDLDRALARALALTDLEAREAALDAMALSAHRDAASAARAEACGDLGDRALVRLAIVGDESDARWLVHRLEASPSAAAVEAVGWSGLIEAIPLLIRLLESDDDEVKRASGAALERMLGAGLLETIEVLPEAIDDSEPPDPDPEARPRSAPLAELVSDPRDRPPAGSKETIEVASVDPDRWRPYWAEHGKSFDPRKRVRRGQLYSPSVSLYELDRLPLLPIERRTLHRELAARTGRITHFDPHDFVAVQENGLKAWESILKAAIEVPGSWSRPIAS